MNPQRGPRYRQVPIWRDATRLLLETEQAVRRFPRYHKYTLGSELRAQAMRVCRLVARAAQSNDAAERAQLLKQLVWQVEDLKMSVQLAKEVEAFASFAQFQRLAEQAVALGRQSGGWWKKAPTLIRCADSLPPEGAVFLPWGGPAPKKARSAAAAASSHGAAPA